MTSPGSTPAFSAGPPASTDCTSAPIGLPRPIDSATSRVSAGDDDADAAADDAPADAQLLRDARRLVDRDRERDAHVAARAAVDLRVDADHLAAHVDQRAAGVAGIDGDVGLDQRQQIAGVARLGADDAGRHRALEAERRADRDHPFADLELGDVADAHRGQAGRLDLDQRDVGALVGADRSWP